MGATALHYGQACFEGLKAFHQKDGSVQVFRPDENAKRYVSNALFVFCHPWVSIFLNLYQITYSSTFSDTSSLLNSTV